MRLKAEAIFAFGPSDEQRPNKIVREYRDEYKALSEILDQYPEILEMAHRDLVRLSRATSRAGVEKRADDAAADRIGPLVCVLVQEDQVVQHLIEHL